MRAWALGLALAACALAARAQDRVVVKPVAQAFPFLREYWKLDPAMRTRFGVAYRWAERDHATPSRLTLLDGGVETPLPATPDGWLTRLPGAAAFAHHARVRIEAPAEVHGAMQLTPEAILPDLGNIEVADVRAATDQLTAVTKRVTGPLSFLIPPFTRAMFSGAEGGSAVDAQGRQEALPVVHGMPTLDLAGAAQARTVRFIRPPYHVLIVPPRHDAARRP